VSPPPPGDDPGKLLPLLLFSDEDDDAAAFDLSFLSFKGVEDEGIIGIINYVCLRIAVIKSSSSYEKVQHFTVCKALGRL
jgi:hypothetical protein